MQIDGRTLSHETSETIRMMAVRRVREGERPSAVIQSYGLCRTSIYRWLRAQRRGGEKALQARKHPGRNDAFAKQNAGARWISVQCPRQYGLDLACGRGHRVELSTESGPVGSDCVGRLLGNWK